MSDRRGPILLFGSPRSGTTWLAKILDAHPDTFYSHEPDSALPPTGVPLFPSLGDLDVHREALASWAAQLKDLRSARITAKLPLFHKSYRGPVAHFLSWAAIMGSKAAPKRLRNAPIPSFAWRDSLARSVWVWKSIESLGRIGALARTLEGVRVILLVRHPCGVVSSVLRGESRAKFTSEVAASEDRGIFELLAKTSEAKFHGLTADDFFAMQPIERLTWRWALTNEKAMNDTKGLENVLVLRYEDLCDEPIAVSRKVLAFAGLEWHSQVEAFLKASVSSEQSAYYSVFKDPRLSARKWKTELDEAQIGHVLSVAGQTAPGRLFPDAELSEATPLGAEPASHRG